MITFIFLRKKGLYYITFLIRANIFLWMYTEPKLIVDVDVISFNVTFCNEHKNGFPSSCFSGFELALELFRCIKQFVWSKFVTSSRLPQRCQKHRKKYPGWVVIWVGLSPGLIWLGLGCHWVGLTLGLGCHPGWVVTWVGLSPGLGWLGLGWLGLGWHLG